MKIVLVSDTWDPDSNDVSISLWNLYNSLYGMGYELFIIHPGMFRVIPFLGLRISLRTDHLDFILQNLNFECIHIATEGPLGLRARRFCRKKNLSFTTSYHTEIPEFLRRKFGIPRKLTLRWLRWFHSAASQTLVDVSDFLTLTDAGFTNLTATLLDIAPTNKTSPSAFVRNLVFKFKVMN